MNKTSAITLTVTGALLLALTGNLHDAHIAEHASTYIQASPPVAANTAAPALVSTEQ
jgi:hypothetical protein